MTYFELSRTIESRIREILAEKNITLKELSRMIGTSEPTIHGMFKRGDYKLSTLVSIAEKLEVSVMTLIDHTVEIVYNHITNDQIFLEKEVEDLRKQIKTLNEYLEITADNLGDKRRVIEFLDREKWVQTKRTLDVIEELPEFDEIFSEDEKESILKVNYFRELDPNIKPKIIEVLRSNAINMMKELGCTLPENFKWKPEYDKYLRIED